MINIDLPGIEIFLRLLNISDKPTRLLLSLEGPDALIIENVVNFFQGLAACFLEKEEDVQGGEKAESAEDTIQLCVVRGVMIIDEPWAKLPSTECFETQAG
jgi:hypothetical protein